MTKFTKIALAAAFAFSLAISANAMVIASPALRVGSTGSDVMSLQADLNSKTGTMLAVDGNFGNGTKSAVMTFQAANGLVADGVVGTKTAEKLNAMGATTGGTFPAGCTSSAGFSTITGESCAATGTTFPAGCTSASGFSATTGESCADGEDTDGGDDTDPADFDGTEGSVKSFEVGAAEESDISEDQEEMEIFSVDVELDEDGDLMINRVDFYFEENSLSGSESSKPWDYFANAYLMIDGDVVADMEVDSSSDWDEEDGDILDDTISANQEYRLRFSGVEEILASDETTPISIAFDALGSIDGTDEGADWLVGTAADSFRFEDGTGFVFTDGSGLEDTFSIDSEEVAELEISASTDDMEASVLEVSDSSDTTEVAIGMFEIEEKQEVDVTIEEMTVVLTTNDAIGDVVKKAYLFNGSDMIGEESVSGTGVSDTVVFDNLGFEIAGDATEEFTVKVDFDDTDDQVRYQNGDTIDVTSVAITEADDEFENDESDITLTGSYSSETHELRSEGISVEVGDIDSTSISVDGVNNDRIELTIEFDVTAFSEDVYVVNAKTATGFATTSTTTAPTTTEGVGYHVQYTGTAPDASTVTSTSLTSTAEEETNSFLVEDGQTETFTLKVVVSNDGAPDLTGTSARAILAGIGFGDSDSATADSVYSFDLSDFKTEYEIIAD